MRIAVFVLGLLATVLVAFFGMAFLFGIPLEAQKWILRNVPGMHTNLPTDDLMRMGIFLIAGAFLGLLGSIFALCRYGVQGGILMIVSVTGPAILNPGTLFGSGLLALTGVLSFFVRHRPAPSPAE